MKSWFHGTIEIPKVDCQEIPTRMLYDKQKFPPWKSPLTQQNFMHLLFSFDYIKILGYLKQSPYIKWMDYVPHSYLKSKFTVAN